MMLTRSVTTEKGHSKRECEIDQAEDEFERVVLKCGNCSALDHRLRDCPEPRKPDYNPNACKNCGCVSFLPSTYVQITDCHDSIAKKVTELRSVLSHGWLMRILSAANAAKVHLPLKCKEGILTLFSGSLF